MHYFKYVLLSILVVSALFMFFFALKSRKPFKTAFINFLFGTVLAVIIFFTGKYTGIKLHINPYTAGCFSFLGVPGVIGLTFLPLIF